MIIFGHRLRFYAEQYVKFKLQRGRGNTLTSELKGLWSAITGGGIIILLVDRIWGVLLPLWVLFIAWVVQTIFEVGLGVLDRRWFKLWQIENEYIQRKGLNRWETTKMRILRKLFEKICPEEKIKHDGYVEEE